MKKRKRLWASILTFGMSLALVLSPLQMAAAAEEVQPLEEKEPVTYYALSQVPENIRQLAGAKEDDGRLIKVTNVYDDEETLRSSLYTLELFDPVEETGQVLMFGAPVKYLDDNGDIRFIDTSLKSMGGFRSLFTGYVYENQANDFTVRYASSAYQGYSIDDQFRLSVKDDGTGSAQNAVVGQQENGAGSVKYGDAFGTSTYVEYINTEGGVKENIVLSENVGKNRFDFTFRSADYHPVLSEDGRYVTVVNNSDPEQVIYRYSSLFAYDSYTPPVTDGEQMVADPSAFRHLNEDCYYELAQEEDGTYIVTVVVPEEYLNHPEIVYPVTIDPSVNIGSSLLNSSNSKITDTFIYGGSPYSVYSNEDFIRVGMTTAGEYKGIVRFDGFYDFLHYSSYISKATIKLTYRNGQTTGPNMRAYLISSIWNEASISYNTAPSTATGKAEYSSSGHIESKNGYYDTMEFSVLGMARLWHNSDDFENMGIMFVYENTAYDTNAFVSANGDAGKAPVLAMEYQYVTPAENIENGGVYYIRNRGNGQYLDLTASSTANGTKAQTYPLDYDDSMCWRISGDSGYYMISSVKDTSRTANLGGGGNCVSGTQADLYGHDYRTNYYGKYFTHSAQLWEITHKGNGIYKISPKRNMSLSLSVSSSGQTATGNPQVIVSDSLDLPRQEWYFEKKCVPGIDYKLSSSSDKDPGYQSMSFTIGVSGGQISNVQAAITGWNFKARTNIKYTSQSTTNYVSIGGNRIKDDCVLGYYDATQTSGGRATRFNIFINEPGIESTIKQNGFNSTQSETLWRHVITHELGHALGLKDNPTGRESIMQYVSDAKLASSYLPEIADVVGVRHYFS